MIPLLLMLAAGQAMTPVEAERAFAADAQKIGQWTAFRKWSTDEATMFVPQATNAHEFLKDRKDPPKAIDWWPTASWISCDGKLAINTGGWRQPNGSVGYFTTVWQRQRDGSWKWIVDGGDDLKVARARPKVPVVQRGACDHPGPKLDYPYLPDKTRGYGGAPDGSVWYSWEVGKDGSREFSASIYRGAGKSVIVVTDKIAAPK